MIKFNRTTEYGLMALRHISRKHALDPTLLTSAREIADSYGLPFEITAKTLQRLKDGGLIQAAHGAKGGYTLQKSLNNISLAEFLELMEGPQTMVLCASATAVIAPKESPTSECEYGTRCEIKHLMNQLNQRVFHFLSGIRLAELALELPEEGKEKHETA